MDEEDKQMWRDKDRGDEDRSPSDIDDVSVCVTFYCHCYSCCSNVHKTKEQSKNPPT